MPTPATANLDQLTSIMDKLLSEEGCPWDREQTHQTLARHLIEESYEVIEAINLEDSSQLQEELGDVLFQIVFHAALANQSGLFDLNDVIKGVSNKMVNRHPHVFASLNLNTSQEVLQHWESFKKKEGKKQLLASIPAMLPALLRALKIQEKAAQAGFDFPQIEDAIDKMNEEINEFASAQTDEESLEEFGDMLFALVNLARFKHIDPEAALQRCNDKFIHRFQHMEEQCHKQNKDIQSFTLKELDDFWEQAKKEEK